MKTLFQILLVLLLPFGLSAQGIITVAGTGAAVDTGDGGPASAAGIYGPASLTFDLQGNLYVGDGGLSLPRVRKITPDGIITTVAGTGISGYSGDGGLATDAQLRNAQGLAVDASGNLYIADAHDNRIRRVDAITGVITTVAGIGVGAFSGDGGPATDAELYVPTDVCFDKAGNMHIGDYSNARVRKVDLSGIITTVVGTGLFSWGYGGDGGPADTTAIRSAHGLCFDDTGNMYITDFSSRVMKVDTFGTITTYAGNGDLVAIVGVMGDGIPATDATVAPPKIALDKFGNLYFAEYLGAPIVRKVDVVTGIITTIAGNGTVGFGGDGGPATDALLHAPGGIITDTCGNLYIADVRNNRVRKVLFYPDCPDTTSSEGGGDTTVSVNSVPVSGIDIYPIPVTDVLHITASGVGQVSITSISGKLLYTQNVTKGDNVISVKELPSGMYLIRYSGSREMIVRRVWKE